jgi:hypothetical protein
MGWTASVPAGFNERTTDSSKDIEIDLALLCARQVGESQSRHPEGASTPPASNVVMIGVLTPKARYSSKVPMRSPAPARVALS